MANSFEHDEIGGNESTTAFEWDEIYPWFTELLTAYELKPLKTRKHSFQLTRTRKTDVSPQLLSIATENPNQPEKEAESGFPEIESLFDDEKCPTIFEFLQTLKQMADKDLLIASQKSESAAQLMKQTGEMPIVLTGFDSSFAKEPGAKLSNVREIYNQLNLIWTKIESFDLEAKLLYFSPKRLAILMRAFEIPYEVGADLAELLHPTGKPTRNAVKERFLGLILKQIEQIKEETEAKTVASKPR